MSFSGKEALITPYLTERKGESKEVKQADWPRSEGTLWESQK